MLRWALVALLLVLAGCAAPGPEGAPSLACAAPCAFALVSADARLWEPHAAVDPRDPLHLVAGVAVLRRDVPEDGAGSFANGLLVAVSRDGGASWSAGEVPHGPAAGPGHPLATARTLADPNVAFLPDGTTLLSGLAYNEAGTPAGPAAQGFRVFLARSSDGGASFPEAVVVDDDVGVASITPAGHRAAALDAPDAPTLAVAPDGTVHMHWRRMVQATPAEPERSVAMAARSTDGGRTWSQPQALDTGGRNAVAGQLVALADGTILSALGAWEGGGVLEATKGYQLLARSDDGGASWSVVTVDDSRVSNLGWWPAVAASAAGVHVAYAVEDEAGVQSVVVRTSTDGGRSFGPRQVVMQGVAPGTALPTMAGDGERAYLTAFQPQEAGGARNRLLAYALGADGVAGPVVLDDSLTEDASELGEYFGVAVGGGRAMPVWTKYAGGAELRGAFVSVAR